MTFSRRQIAYVALAVVLLVGVTGIFLNRLTPEDVGARKLTQVDSFPAGDRSIIVSAIDDLERQGEDPREFFAVLGTRDTNTPLTLDLWHESAFSRWSFGDSGNPGGKSRSMYFDSSGELIKTRWWK